MCWNVVFVACVCIYIYICVCVCMWAHNRMSDPKMNLYVCMCACMYVFSNLRAVSENWTSTEKKWRYNWDMFGVIYTDSKKKKKKKNKGSKNQGTAQQKPEGVLPLEVFTASGFDVSQFAAMNVSKLCIEPSVHKFIFWLHHLFTLCWLCSEEVHTV